MAKTCPCKLAPAAYSSHTAAEYGNMATLINKKNKTNTDDMITPLHLAAQHGHVAATQYLLNQGPFEKVNPLHRASFSGAVGTLRVLLDYHVAWIAQPDTSFGDLQLPLHKAAAGGRYLAIHLLLQYDTKQLQARDAQGRTPRDVAVQARRSNDTDSVARWNQVAGGLPDWELCVQLLRRAEMRDAKGLSAVEDNTLPGLPDEECINCDDCSKSEAWSLQFRQALSSSLPSLSNGSPFSLMMDPPQVENPPREVKEESDLVASVPATIPRTLCGVCCQPTIALYKRKGRLVCRKCK